jgi:hypothetical protein
MTEEADRSVVSVRITVALIFHLETWKLLRFVRRHWEERFYLILIGNGYGTFWRCGQSH